MKLPSWSLLAGLLVCGSVMDLAAGDWPMYRADAGRSGYTEEAIPNQLTLRWEFRTAHAPQPAWTTSERVRYDRVFQPILMGDLVVFGSSADDQVYAIDAASGKLIWSFFTGAPVRFAPAGWKDRVFVASDDGWLYTLGVADGKLLWKHRGGPSGEMVIGNERMVSKWPARGGPVVFGETVYFCAGVWPSDGVFLHALDAKTGKPVWANLESGGIYMPQPHGRAEAKSGVSSQGYLGATEDAILVPTGRAVPAAFERADGKLRYYHLQKNQHRGGSRAMVTDGFFLNDGTLFDLGTGDLNAEVGGGAAVAVPGGMVRANGRSLVVYGWKDVDTVDRKGAAMKARRLEESRLVSMEEEILEFIVAGGDAVCGEDGMISAVDYKRQRTRWWEHEVEGKVLGIAAANGRVVASTDAGVIYCFDGEGVVAKGEKDAVAEVTVDADYEAAAKEILKESGIREGFCVDVAAGSGELALALAKHSKLHIYAIEEDAKKVAAARARLDAAGLYGTRVTVHHGKAGEVAYPKYFANLVVSAASLKGKPGEAALAEMQRMQRPGGGIMITGKAGAMKMSRRAALAGSGEWSHQNSNAANTLCSDDEIVKGPLSMFWFRDVDFEIPNRHGQGPAPLFADGYLVVGGVDGICCVDAYNGRVVWIYSLEGHLADFDGIHHDVGVSEAGSNFCLGGGAVFVRNGDRCLRIDLASGELVGEFKTPVGEKDVNRNWGYLAYDAGTLYGSVLNDAHRVSTRYKLTKLRTESVSFFAMDAETGHLKWSHAAKDSIRNNAVTVGAGRVYLVDRPLIGEDHIAEPVRDRKHVPTLTPDKIPPGRLVALDVKTGEEIWRNEEEIFGTQLSVSAKHSMLVMNYQAANHGFFKLPSEIGGRIAGFDIASGKKIWEAEGKYRTRPLINDDVIYSQGGAWNVLTGAPVPFEFERTYGCGQISASKHMMLFRSATLGYKDLSREEGTENYGGIRPSCFINAVPAGGLVLVPDGSSKCKCSYQMRSWFALQGQ